MPPKIHKNLPSRRKRFAPPKRRKKHQDAKASNGAATTDIRDSIAVQSNIDTQPVSQNAPECIVRDVPDCSSSLHHLASDSLCSSPTVQESNDDKTSHSDVITVECQVELKWNSESSLDESMEETDPLILPPFTSANTGQSSSTQRCIQECVAEPDSDSNPKEIKSEEITEEQLVTQDALHCSDGRDVRICPASTSGDAENVESNHHSDEEVRGVEQVTTKMNNLLKKVRDLLFLSLPNSWICVVKDGGIHVGLCSPMKCLVIQRALVFSPDGNVEAAVHGKVLSPGHPFWLKWKGIVLCADNVGLFAENISRLTTYFGSTKICQGVELFQPLWKWATNAKVDMNPFQESAYNETCRSNECAFLVERLGRKRCLACAHLTQVLKKKHIKISKMSSTPTSKKAHKYLTTSEKIERLQKNSKTIKSLQEANKRLREKVSSLVRGDGVDKAEVCSVDPAALPRTSDINKDDGLTDFQKLFIEQQMKAASVKSPSGMRWHPDMIRLALSLKMKSSAAYEELRGLLRLPSERQLFDYSRCLSTTGLLNDFRAQ